MQSSRLSAFLLLAAAILFWSGNWITGRAVRDAFDPVTLNFWRWFVATLVLAPFALPGLRDKWGEVRRHAGILLLLAFTGVALFQSLIYLGLRTTAAVNAVLLNVNMLSISRLPLAMAQDRFAPAYLAKVSPTTGAPVVSLVVGAIFYSVLTLRGFTDLINIYAFLQAANYLMIYMSLVKLRSRMPDAPRPYRIPGGRLGLALVVLPPCAVTLMALYGEADTVRWGRTAIAIGPLAYLVALAMRNRPAAGP